MRDMAYYPVIAVLSAVVIIVSSLYFLIQLIKLIISVSRYGKTLPSRHLRKAGIAVSFFVVAMILINAMTSAIFTKAEVLLANESVTVTVDGVQMPKNLIREFLANYRDRYWSKSLAGSRPTSEHVVNITSDGESLIFSFKRDSRNSEMYWVYYSDLLVNFKAVFINTSTIEKNDESR